MDAPESLSEVINEALKDVKSHSIERYYAPLLSLKQRLQDQKKSEEAAVVALLVGLTTGLGGSIPEDLFRSLTSRLPGMAGQLGPLELYLPKLRAIAPHIHDPELRATVLDFCSHEARDYREVQDAIGAYLESAERLTAEGTWPAAADRFERAALLALSLGRGKPDLQRVSEAITDALHKALQEESFFALRLLELMHKKRLAEPLEVAAHAEEYAKDKLAVAEDERNELAAREYLSFAARVLQSRDPVKSAALQADIARSYEREAGKAASGSGQSKKQEEAHWLGLALRAWRSAPSAAVEVQRVHKRLLEVQEAALAELMPLVFPEDVSEIEERLRETAENARQWVRRGSPEAALGAFAFVSKPMSVRHLDEQVDDELSSPLRALFPYRLLDQYGRTRAVESDDPDERAEQIRMKLLAQHQYYSAAIALQPAYEELRRLVEPYALNVAYRVVAGHPFIRPGHEELAAIAVADGLQGRIVQAIHVALPQIEDGLRFLLESMGFVTSSYLPSSEQRDYLLNRILEGEPAAALEGVLGADTVMDLRSLLVSKHGTNFRNEALHGRYDSGAFYSLQALYVWWSYIRFLMLPVLAPQVASDYGDRDGDSRGEQEAAGETT